MDIYAIEILDYTFPCVKIRCHVGSGTFIRSIAYELGQRLGTGGIITALHRESVGDYSINDPQCIQDLLAIKQKNS
jgi:tRNA pseudouridine55 synthase